MTFDEYYHSALDPMIVDYDFALSIWNAAQAQAQLKPSKDDAPKWAKWKISHQKIIIILGSQYENPHL